MPAKLWTPDELLGAVAPAAEAFQIVDLGHARRGQAVRGQVVRLHYERGQSRRRDGLAGLEVLLLSADDVPVGGRASFGLDLSEHDKTARGDQPRGLLPHPQRD